MARSSGPYRGRRGIATVAAMLLCTITWSSTAVQAATAHPHPVFAPIVATLRHSHIPLALPSYIPTEVYALPHQRIYAVIDGVTLGHYSVIIGFTRDCNGASVCRLGTVTGDVLRPHRPRLHGKLVRLIRGITGYFVDATCGAGCSDATVSWDQHNDRYSVGLKAGARPLLVHMANSAIATGGSLVPAQRVYSVEDVQLSRVAHPQALIGRTILVRGVALRSLPEIKLMLVDTHAISSTMNGLTPDQVAALVIVESRVNSFAPMLFLRPRHGFRYPNDVKPRIYRVQLRLFSCPKHDLCDDGVLLSP